MPEASTSSSPIDQLFTLGKPDGGRNWLELDPDYASQFGFTSAHTAQLIELALTWADEQHEWADDASDYAPIHAWRTLGQLGAIEAVEPLLSTLEYLDRIFDDWSMEDYPYVFALIGPQAIEILEAYISNPNNSDFPRVTAAHGLCEIAQRHPASRGQVVRILTEQLGKQEQSKYDLNGNLVAYLLDLQAVESAETIERAFAAGVIDEGIAGDWSKVCQELGVEGLGLPQPQVRHNSGQALRQSFLSAQQAVLTNEARRKRNKKLKAKRKQQQKSRRRNRKAK